MLTIDFPDKSVTYDTFVRDVASSVVRMLADTHNDPEMVSLRKAYAMFGRGNVDRWRKQGKITPCKRPGKVEYRTIELRTLQRLQQDYFK
nr:MAG: Pyocin activator protein PrtN [Bacteriophage sp.]